MIKGPQLWPLMIERKEPCLTSALNHSDRLSRKWSVALSVHHPRSAVQSADLWALRPPGRRGRSRALASPAQPQVLLDPSETLRSCSIGRQPLRRAAGSPPSFRLLQRLLASQRSSEVCAAELLPSQLRGAAPVEVLHTAETFPAWSGSPQQLCWVSFDACTS